MWFILIYEVGILYCNLPVQSLSYSVFSITLVKEEITVILLSSTCYFVAAVPWVYRFIMVPSVGCSY